MSKPREHLLTYTGAGQRDIQAAGRFVRLMECTGNSDVFVSLDGSSEIQMRPGQQIQDSDPKGYTRLTVRSAIAQTVRLITSDASTDDTGQSVSVNVSATVAGSSALTAPAVVSVPALTTVQIAAANPARVELRVALKSDAASHVWLGPLGVGDEEGGLLEPGTIDYLGSTAAVYAHNPHATDAVNVSVLDMESP